MKCILAAALASLILLATPALGEPIAPVSLVASNDYNACNGKNNYSQGRCCGFKQNGITYVGTCEYDNVHQLLCSGNLIQANSAYCKNPTGCSCPN